LAWCGVTTTYEDHWGELAGAALLGTDRRSAPEPLGGPMAGFIAPLDQVAALAALRRAGLRPGPAAPPLITPPVDLRPVCLEAASRRLHEIIEQWPVLIDEWLRLARAGGWRLAPELVPTMLQRFRTDGRRRSAVIELAGPVADWLVELDLAPIGGGKPAAPDLDLPPPTGDLAPLWALPGDQLAAALLDGLTRAQLANRHRPVLVRLICEVPVERLAPVIDALSRAATNAATMGLALTLADLAQIRATMIQELL
jgi:hypothetical protein